MADRLATLRGEATPAPTGPGDRARRRTLFPPDGSPLATCACAMDAAIGTAAEAAARLEKEKARVVAAAEAMLQAAHAEAAAQLEREKARVVAAAEAMLQAAQDAPPDGPPPGPSLRPPTPLFIRRHRACLAADRAQGRPPSPSDIDNRRYTENEIAVHLAQGERVGWDGLETRMVHRARLDGRPEIKAALRPVIETAKELALLNEAFDKELADRTDAQANDPAHLELQMDRHFEKYRPLNIRLVEAHAQLRIAFFYAGSPLQEWPAQRRPPEREIEGFEFWAGGPWQYPPQPPEVEWKVHEIDIEKAEQLVIKAEVELMQRRLRCARKKRRYGIPDMLA